MAISHAEGNRAFIDNPVILISGNLPGTGASTLAEGLHKALSDRGSDVYIRFVGKAIRESLGVSNDEELSVQLDKINDPEIFDKNIYSDLPEDRTCIIEGKLATTAGPRFIDGSKRPTILINLTSSPLFSAKRILDRDGKPLEILFGESPDQVIIEQLTRIKYRSEHDDSLRKAIKTVSGKSEEPVLTQELNYDTSKFSAEEVISDVLGTKGYEDHAPDWEFAALNKTIRTLMLVGFDLRKTMNPQDKAHYNHQMENINHNMDRLSINLYPDALNKIRSNLKKAIIDCWFGLMLKRTPRFFVDIETNELEYDTESHSWSPEYYKIAEGWPFLSILLKDKTILDPFAGAGTMMNLLVARGIPKGTIYSDIAYRGGPGVNGSKRWYDPVLNTQASQLLFDNLPSWYKPDFSKPRGYITADAKKLPLSDNSVDYVFADPPYGKNLDGPGIGVLFGCLNEFKRVAKEGSIFMIPIDWLADIKASGIDFKQLTRDVSGGNSKFPVCYVLIN